MSSSKIRIGINGFGRIGRCVARIAMESRGFELVAVNDLVEDMENLVYLYNHDSTYGRAPKPATIASESKTALIDGATVRFHCHHATLEVPWEAHRVDVVIDATGVAANVAGSNALARDGRVRKAIITHSPEKGVDRYVIMGVNDGDYDPATDNVVSTTICDANAIAHVLQALDLRFGIEGGYVTTLHPWLSYQNLVDGPIEWQWFPGTYWKDYSLGRSSVGTLIPKNSTAVTALRPIMPEIESRLAGFSFRIPTQIVAAADLSIRLRSDTSVEDLYRYFCQHFRDSHYVDINRDALVGVDFSGSPFSATIDARWLKVVDKRMVKIILWYDNEWGYSSRVIDLARMMARSWQ